MTDLALVGATHWPAPLADFDVGQAAEEIGYNLIAAAVVVSLVWFRDEIFLRVGAAYRWLYSLATGKRFVLVWIDDDPRHASNLVSKLREREGEDRLSFHTIKRPRSLLFYPRSPGRTACIVLLDTDVSKLADEPRAAALIEDRLCAFVQAGGGLIGSHDLIYRRARNEKLQLVFGCKMTKFKTYKDTPVPYRLDPGQADHPLAAGLPEAYGLNDGEVCWGDWDPGATVVFATDDEQRRPLVVCNRYWDGRVVWLNSGDKGDRQCASIAEPEEPLLVLIHNALRWARKDA